MTEVLVSGQMPEYANPGDAGADLRSTVDVWLSPGERRVFGTGTRIALPDGYVAFVNPRSGLAAKHGITIVNAPGTVDAGYRGEIKVILLNTGDAAHHIESGDRIAQMVILQLPQVSLRLVDELPESERGENGFGSSGFKSQFTTQYGRSADA